MNLTKGVNKPKRGHGLKYVTFYVTVLKFSILGLGTQRVVEIHYIHAGITKK